MQNRFRRARLTVALTGAASLLCGIVVLINPTGVALFMTSLIGAVLAVTGVVTLVGYARRRDVSGAFDLAAGVVELLLGLALWGAPEFFVGWLVVMIGVFVLLSGFGDLAEASALRSLDAPFAGGETLIAVLTIVIGALVVVSPFALVDLAFAVAGVGLVFNGVTELVSAFKM